MHKQTAKYRATLHTAPLCLCTCYHHPRKETMATHLDVVSLGNLVNVCASLQLALAKSLPCSLTASNIDHISSALLSDVPRACYHQPRRETMATHLHVVSLGNLVTVCTSSQLTKAKRLPCPHYCNHYHKCTNNVSMIQWTTSINTTTLCQHVYINSQLQLHEPHHVTGNTTSLR